MPTVISIENLSDEEIAVLQKRAKTKRDFQKVQTLALKRLNYRHDEIKTCLNVGRDNITRTLSKYRKKGPDALFEDGRGGRKHENMSEEEEKLFLKPFLKQAEKGGVLIANKIHIAYEKAVGRKIPLSTIYAMLHRNGWRKISPRPKHPKGDEVKQKAFKDFFPLPNKNSETCCGN